ncbi:MAG: fibronectin type III domain-containing protein [Planctomycetes bacterium]|nr:fibronectin type III domain-containing protein [Planctomycetota bacterium]
MRILNRTEDSLTLAWQKPPRNPHRPVGCYQVYCRPVNPSKNGTGWYLTGTALEPEFTLSSQPAGKTEFRITALNRSGESLPSNTITVTL